ncbi:hypothetical protein CPB83DRAFT_911328 [Crepidotus variabilis]|uniref:Uncharacterized protein n=1 Tax=Crepidotus variabilis TaxID=179855 RepID=A0A9P6JIM2_9AGAR|nr:hypothetical protein CPB83DRAFT_911328 [Crepidotus variabilis]
MAEDYVDQSMLSGLAAVGGLWAFFAGIFAAIFGTSMMRILFGLKPLSVFGLIHWFQKLQLKEACTMNYPRMEHDLKAPHPDRGLISLIYDQLLDVDFLHPMDGHIAQASPIDDSEETDLANWEKRSPESFAGSTTYTTQ